MKEAIHGKHTEAVFVIVGSSYGGNAFKSLHAFIPDKDARLLASRLAMRAGGMPTSTCFSTPSQISMMTAIHVARWSGTGRATTVERG